MRLKQALIEGGAAFGNPEMTFPNKSDYLIDDDGVERYKEAVEFWNSGRLPFEDNFTAKSLVILDNPDSLDGMILPDGLYSVDLDVTVVEQWNANGIWLDRPEHRQGTPIYQETKYEYRKVLRIKP